MLYHPERTDFYDLDLDDPEIIHAMTDGLTHLVEPNTCRADEVPDIAVPSAEDEFFASFGFDD